MFLFLIKLCLVFGVHFSKAEWMNLNENHNILLSAPYSWKTPEKKDLSEKEYLQIFKNITNARKNSCIIGAISHGGGNRYKKGLCENRIEYVKKFELKSGRRTANMNDILNSMKNLSRVMVLGDSLTNQFWDSLLCDAQRSGSRVGQEFVYKRYLKNLFRGTITHSEVNITSSNGNLQQLFFHKEYRFSKDGQSIHEACYKTDILIFNYGLHWNSQKEFTKDARKIATFMKLHCQNTTVIFRGSTRQHFKNWGGYFQKGPNKEYFQRYFPRQNITNKSLQNSGCTRIVDEKEIGDWRNSIMIDAFKESGYSIHKSYTESANGQVLYYIPFGELTFDMYYHHGLECTHYCYSPFFWSPVFDGIYGCIIKEKRLDVPKIVNDVYFKSAKIIDNDPHFMIENFKNLTDVYKS